MILNSPMIIINIKYKWIAICIFQHFMGITVDIDFKLTIHNSWMLPDDSPANAVSCILNTDLQESWNKEILRSKLFCYELRIKQLSESCAVLRIKSIPPVVILPCMPFG